MAETPLVYIRGRLVPAAEAHVSIYDFGVVMGVTITDLLRTFHQQPYRLDDHIRRFYDSCKYARIVPPIPPEETAKITHELVRHNAVLAGVNAELAVVYFITPGENLVYAGSAAPGAGLRRPRRGLRSSGRDEQQTNAGNCGRARDGCAHGGDAVQADEPGLAGRYGTQQIVELERVHGPGA